MQCQHEEEDEMPRPTKRQAPIAELDEDLAQARKDDARSFADVDESSADSFPASDPPAWASLRVGAPRKAVARADENHSR